MGVKYRIQQTRPTAVLGGLRVEGYSSGLDISPLEGQCLGLDLESSVLELSSVTASNNGLTLKSGLKVTQGP